MSAGDGVPEFVTLEHEGFSIRRPASTLLWLRALVMGLATAAFTYLWVFEGALDLPVAIGALVVLGGAFLILTFAATMGQALRVTAHEVVLVEHLLGWSRERRVPLSAIEAVTGSAWKGSKGALSRSVRIRSADQELVLALEPVTALGDHVKARVELDWVVAALEAAREGVDPEATAGEEAMRAALEGVARAREARGSK